MTSAFGRTAHTGGDISGEFTPVFPEETKSTMSVLMTFTLVLALLSPLTFKAKRLLVCARQLHRGAHVHSNRRLRQHDHCDSDHHG